METLYLLKSPANAAHLAKSIAQYQAGETIVRGLIEPTDNNVNYEWATDLDRYRLYEVDNDYLTIISCRYHY